MNRSDLQRLSNARIREAKILFEAGEFSGAYYLAGYAVECALKACISKATQQHDFPDKDRVNKSYSHDLAGLMKVAEVYVDFEFAMRSDRMLEDDWIIVKD
jgi:HEPN domain-containing protein